MLNCIFMANTFTKDNAIFLLPRSNKFIKGNVGNNPVTVSHLKIYFFAFLLIRVISKIKIFVFFLCEL